MLPFENPKIYSANIYLLQGLFKWFKGIFVDHRLLIRMIKSEKKKDK